MELTRPLWIDPAERSFPSLEGEIAVDVAIVGGGFTGLGGAHALADSGLSVALLESRTIASGASGRNAGFVLAGPAMTYDDSVEQLGRTAARDLWQFTVENNREIGRLIEEHGILCGYLQRGSMSLAGSEAEWEKLRRIRALLAADRVETVLAEQVDLPKPFDRMFYGGLYYPRNAELNAGLFLRFLSTVLASSVSVYESSPVEDLKPSGSGWLLRLPTGSVAASTVILATNAYTSRLLPTVPIVARRGQILATAPIGKPICPFPMYANYGYQYWRQTAEGCLIAGGWRDVDPDVETGEEEIGHVGIHRTLDAFVERVVGDVRVDYRWCGIMGFTPDNLPLVGAVPGHTKLFIAAGYSGHGVSMALKCGEEVAKMVVGRPHELPPAFDPVRLEPARAGI